MAVSGPCWGAASALWLSGAARCTADGFLLWQLFSAFTLWIHCVNLTFRWWREENCTYKWALNLLQTVCCGRCRTILSPVDKTNLSSRSTFFLFCSFAQQRFSSCCFITLSCTFRLETNTFHHKRSTWYYCEQTAHWYANWSGIVDLWQFDPPEVLHSYRCECNRSAVRVEVVFRFTGLHAGSCGFSRESWRFWVFLKRDGIVACVRDNLQSWMFNMR